MNRVQKREIEEKLGCAITDEHFMQALRDAKKKLQYIYERDGRAVVLERWYLVEVTAECARAIALSKFTMDLCRELYSMEKEHLVKNRGALTANHIVTSSAL